MGSEMCIRDSIWARSKKANFRSEYGCNLQNFGFLKLKKLCYQLHIFLESTSYKSGFFGGERTEFPQALFSCFQIVFIDLHLTYLAFRGATNSTARKLIRYVLQLAVILRRYIIIIIFGLCLV